MENYGFMLGIGKKEEADLIKIAADTMNLLDEQRKRLDRAIELYELEKRGRIVVLPCKVGEKVWVNHPRFWVPYQIVYPSVIAILSDVADGYIFCETREEAEKALKEDAHDST